jgi:hypothetical protein
MKFISKYYFLYLPLLTINFCTYAQSPTHPIYLGRYPDNGTPNWGDNKTATQGIAHDKRNWFICAAGTSTHLMELKENEDWIIWKIPVGEPLDQDFYNSKNPNVKHIRRRDFPKLDQLGIYHAGDLVHYYYNNEGFLMVPMYGPNGPIIIAFNSNTLAYLDYFELSNQKDIGWCAVTPSGELATSNDEADAILIYEVDWKTLATDGKLSLKQLSRKPITLLNGSKIKNVQGGEFSADGKYLYLSSGIALTKENTDGLHVFETSAWKEVSRSCNPERGESCDFSFSFNNGAVPPDEPQGLTIWDLDNGTAPVMRGQLHALVYSWRVSSSHKVTIMNYSLKASNSEHGIRLYEHPNFRGDSRYFETDVPDLDNGKINFADVASSLKLEGISSVKLYDGHSFTGVMIEVKGDISDLTTLRFNDRIDSFKLISKSTNEKQTVSPSVKKNISKGVRLYEHPNYGGDSRFFQTDSPDLDHDKINFADVASSVKLIGISSVKLYDGNHYTGAVINITHDVSDLSAWKFNDRVGSLKLGH